MIISNQNNETKSLKLLRFGRYVMYGQQNVLREIFSKPVSIFALGIQKIFACGWGNPGLWNPKFSPGNPESL